MKNQDGSVKKMKTKRFDELTEEEKIEIDDLIQKLDCCLGWVFDEESYDEVKKNVIRLYNIIKGANCGKNC